MCATVFKSSCIDIHTYIHIHTLHTIKCIMIRCLYL